MFYARSCVHGSLESGVGANSRWLTRDLAWYLTWKKRVKRKELRGEERKGRRQGRGVAEEGDGRWKRSGKGKLNGRKKEK